MNQTYTYGQRLAQRLRERADKIDGWTDLSTAMATEWRCQANLAEREWPLPYAEWTHVAWPSVEGRRMFLVPVSNNYEAMLHWYDEHDALTHVIKRPTPADLHRALLWLVGLAESPI